MRAKYDTVKEDEIHLMGDERAESVEFAMIRVGFGDGLVCSFEHLGDKHCDIAVFDSSESVEWKHHGVL